MDDFQALSANRLLFDLASRLGSLEGYLYAEEKVDKSYLPNWIDNIDHEFKGLSPEVRSEIQSDFLALLRKVRDLLHKAYGERALRVTGIDTLSAEDGPCWCFRAGDFLEGSFGRERQGREPRLRLRQSAL